MNKQTDNQYADLAERLTDAALELPVPSGIRDGDAAALAGREFLLGEYGNEAALSEAIRRGRPRVGADSPRVSVTVRGRITDADAAAFAQLEAKTGKNQSQLVREAVHLLLASSS